MKKRLFLILIVMLAVGLTACGTDEKTETAGSNPVLEDDTAIIPSWFRKVARITLDDGWCFTFIQNGEKDGSETDQIKYIFFGMNIRYKYDSDYIQTVTQTTEHGYFLTARIAPGILLWGRGSDAQRRDYKIINAILDNDRSVEELLALNPDDYTFEELDKDMFFALIRTGLTSEPQREGTLQSYWDKPSYAIYIEPEWMEGYKFQIAFLASTGLVDELYIDVLYKTGDKYDEYVQLSDMVDAGTATQEQKEAFEVICKIVEDIKENDIYIYNADSYKEKVIGGLDFSRLYYFLNNIHTNNFDPYLDDMIFEVVEEGTLNDLVQ